MPLSAGGDWPPPGTGGVRQRLPHAGWHRRARLPARLRPGARLPLLRCTPCQPKAANSPSILGTGRGTFGAGRGARLEAAASGQTGAATASPLPPRRHRRLGPTPAAPNSCWAWRAECDRDAMCRDVWRWQRGIRRDTIGREERERDWWWPEPGFCIFWDTACPGGMRADRKEAPLNSKAGRKMATVVDFWLLPFWRGSTEKIVAIYRNK